MSISKYFALIKESIRDLERIALAHVGIKRHHCQMA